MAITAAELEIVAKANTKDAEAGVKSLDTAVTNSGKGMKDYKAGGMALLGAGTAIAAGFGLAIGTAANFEQQIANINAVSDLTPAQLGQVRDMALELGSSTSFSASEAASGIEELLKAGISFEDVIGGAGQAALDMAAATGVAVPEAANIMSAAVNVFGADAAHAANVFSQAANASAADASDLALGFAQSATVAQQFGMSLDDNVTALALFSQAGLSGSDAGTSFKTMLLSMLNPTAEQSQLMNDLGLSFFDAQGNFVGLEGSAEQLKTALSGMSEEQRLATLETLFGSDAVRAASILYEEGAEGVKEMRGEMAKQGTVQEMAAKRMNTLNGAIEQFKGALETSMIIVGSAFIPALRVLAEGMTKAVGLFLDAPPALQKIVMAAVALAGGLMVLAGAAVVLGPIFATMGAALGLLLSPIVLIVAAIAALGAAMYLAYTTNFLGFADGIHAIIDALGVFKPMLGDLMDAFQALKEGDFAEVWDELKEAFTSLGEALDTLRPQIIAALSGIWDAISGFDWGGALSTAAGALLAGASAMVGAIKDGAEAAWPTVQTWLEGIPDLVTGAIGEFGDFLISAGGDLLAGMITGFEVVWPVVSSWLGSIGSKALAAAPDLASSLVAKGGELISGLITGFTTVWPVVSAWLLNVGMLALTAIGDLQSTLISKGGELLTGLITGLVTVWPVVSAWLLSVGPQALAAIGDLTVTLISKGGELLAGMITGLVAVWPVVEAWLAGVGGYAIAAVGDLSRTIRSKGVDLLAGFKDGILDKWADVKYWLSALPAWVFTAIPDLSRTIRSKGWDAISGMYDGVLDRWASLSSWLGGLGGYILGAVPDLSGTLIGVGWDLIAGLASGIIGAASSLVSSAIATVASYIPDWARGALGINSPSRVMIPIGEGVSEGLAVGIKKEAGRSLAAAMDYTADAIAGYGVPGMNAGTYGIGYAGVNSGSIYGSGAASARPAGNVYYITNHISVDLEGLEELAQAAEFVSALPRERQLINGGTI